MGVGMLAFGLSWRRVAAVFLFALLCIPASARADAWGEYCFVNRLGTQVCRDTEEDAWAAYNADRNLVSSYVPTGEVSATNDGRITIWYRIAFAAPVSSSPYFYQLGGQAGGSSNHPIGDPCPDEPATVPGNRQIP